MEESNLPFSVFSKLNKGDRFEAINILFGALNHSEVEIFLQLLDETLGDGELSKKSMPENAVKTEESTVKNSSRRLAHFQVKWCKESESPVDANGEKICNYIAKNDNDNLVAVCTACHVNIYIGTMGASAIYQHSDSNKHRRARKDLSIRKPLSDSNSSTANVRKERISGRYLSKFQRDWICEDLSPVDSNGEKFSSYIAQDEDDRKVYCRTCEARIDITNLGAAAINQHSKTAKHFRLRGLNNSASIEKEMKELGNVVSKSQVQNICSKYLSVDDKEEILRHVNTMELKTKAKSKTSRRVCKFKPMWLLENSPLDSNGEKFSSYIVKYDDRRAFCIRCNAIIDITNSGATSIIQHSKSKKHSYSRIEMV